MRFSMLSLSILSLGAFCVGAFADEKPPLKIVVTAKAPQTIAEIDAEIALLKRRSVDLEKYAMSKWLCSHDLARTCEELDRLRAELKKLNSQKGEDERLASLKKDIEEREKALSEYDEAMRGMPDKMNENRKKIADLLTVRERLAGSLPPPVDDKKGAK